MEKRYTILEELGSGGFGSVFRARDEMLQRDVAIKRLGMDLGAEELRAQLLREARVLAAMQHPNIVSIYDISSTKDHDEIVMELLEGVSLDRLVKRHLLHASDLRNVAGQILKALEAAHASRVLHCDLKPENIMLCLSSGDHYEAKVYDFGLSKPKDDADEDGKSKMVGSIYVMAPELFNGEKPSVQTDLYALGCILYYLLVGQYPFVGENSVQVMAAHLTGNHQPVSVYRDDLSSELCLWVESLIRTNVADRTPSAKEALIGLRAVDLSEVAEEVTFTLSTGFDLMGDNSRLVRRISIESLNPDEFHAGDHTTVVLHNTFDDTMRVEVRPELPGVVRREAKPAFVLSEHSSVPADAEWFFTLGEDAKGPVNLEQLKKLCMRGRVVKETLVWHSYFVDWVSAAECAETKAAFKEKKEFAAAAMAKIEKEQGVVVEEVSEQAGWLGFEVIGLFLVGVLGVAFYVVFPEWRREVVLVYSALMLGLAALFWWTYEGRGKVVLCAVMGLLGLGGLAVEASRWFGVFEGKAVDVDTGVDVAVAEEVGLEKALVDREAVLKAEVAAPVVVDKPVVVEERGVKKVVEERGPAKSLAEALRRRQEQGN